MVFLVLSKRYTLRERNREINIQAIVEEHYERYMDQEEEYMRQIHSTLNGLTDSSDSLNISEYRLLSNSYTVFVKAVTLCSVLHVPQ